MVSDCKTLGSETTTSGPFIGGSVVTVVGSTKLVEYAVCGITSANFWAEGTVTVSLRTCTLDNAATSLVLTAAVDVEEAGTTLVDSAISLAFIVAVGVTMDELAAAVVAAAIVVVVGDVAGIVLVLAMGDA